MIKFLPGTILLLACILAVPAQSADQIAVILLKARPGQSVGADGQMTFNDTGTAAGADVYYNKGNSRLGIGLTDPTVRLDVNGSVEAAEYFVDGNPVGFNTNNVIAAKLGLGVDTYAGYPFGDNTFVLSENNLRMYFHDANHPDKSDWRIKINDSTNGGASYFAVFEVPKDYTGESQDASLPAPFRIGSDGSAGPSRTMTIKTGSGRVGIDTTDPQSAVQVAGYTQVTPTLPPASDCDGQGERGRLQLHTNGTMFICTDFGWLIK